MEVREEAAGPSSSPPEGNGVGPLAPPKKTLNTGVQALSLWVEEKLRLGHVPRISDMIEMSKRDGFSVKRSDLLKMLQENPVYMFNMHQQKKRLGSRSYRPIVATSLGYLHCDIGYFSKSKHYSTPPTFQAGFLVARDILSRYVYLIVLRKSRKGASMISAFESLLALHSAAGHTHPVRGISFDRERSVMSKEVQNFLEKKHIKFTSFKMSSSKAKHAESLIKQVRTDKWKFSKVVELVGRFGK